MRQFVINDVGTVAIRIAVQNNEVAILPALIKPGDFDLLSVVVGREFGEPCFVIEKKNFDRQFRQFHLLKYDGFSYQLMEGFELPEDSLCSRSA